MYKKFSYLLAIVTVAAIAFFINGCQDESITPPGIESPVIGDLEMCTTPNIFGGSPGTICVDNPCPGTVNTIDLWAGVGNNGEGGVLVGKVEFTLVGTQWKVKYLFTEADFEPESIHFSIECTENEIPQTRQGNPIPGQFEYSFIGPFGSSYEFNITLPTGCGTCFYVAAHAGGTLGGRSCFNASIPTGCVNITNMVHGFNIYPPVNADTGCYWNFNLSNAGSFNGNWCGWCMDLGTYRGALNYNCAHMFSSLEPFPEYLKPYVQGWQEMDKINYLINNFEVGQTVQLKGVDCLDSGGTGVLTVIDIQKVMWMILDEGPGIQPEWEALSTIGKRNAVYCDVMANGEGFIPSCASGDLIVFIIDPGLNPDQTRAQPIFAYAPCCDAHGVTAWGDGKYGANFTSSSWAKYFKWCTTCP